MTTTQAAERDEKAKSILSAIERAYSLGVAASQSVNRRYGSSAAFHKRERESINLILKTLGAAPLTDAEYEAKFNW